MAGKEFRCGIIIPVYNRWEYFRHTLMSLNASIIPAGCTFYIINDGSTCDATLRLFNYFNFRHPVIKTTVNRLGVAQCLRKGFDMASNDGCNILCNLDSDVDVKEKWFDKLIKLHKHFPDAIVSGFNSNNKSHKIIKTANTFYVKSSSGGINMMFSDRMYHRIIRGTLQDNKWDLDLSKVLQKRNIGIIVSRPSVVQHIGVDSVLGHKIVDIAEDY